MLTSMSVWVVQDCGHSYTCFLPRCLANVDIRERLGGARLWPFVRLLLAKVSYQCYVGGAGFVASLHVKVMQILSIHSMSEEDLHLPRTRNGLRPQTLGEDTGTTATPVKGHNTGRAHRRTSRPQLPVKRSGGRASGGNDWWPRTSTSSITTRSRTTGDETSYMQNLCTGAASSTTPSNGGNLPTTALPSDVLALSKGREEATAQGVPDWEKTVTHMLRLAGMGAAISYGGVRQVLQQLGK